MALRLVNKINRQFIKNVSRSMSTARDAVDIEPEQEEVKPKTNDNQPAQYQVCRPRTTPVERFHKEAQNEAEAAKQYVALQHLQPALLPEYYTPPLEIHSSICPEPLTEEEKQSNQIRRFEESKTCSNVTLPLRGPKLASPFPSPVKVMESHTVSDREKAEQMLAETKAYRGTSTNQSRHQHLTKQIPTFRSYSTNNAESGEKEKPCPKLKQTKSKAHACKHFQLHHCDPPKTISCKRDKARMECKKKEAPYPSYSESCHEEPLEKPSECKICPWKPEEHPTFKPPKKDFHSSSGHFLPKKEQCNEPAGRNKKSVCTDDGEKKKDKPTKKKPKKKCSPLLAPIELHCTRNPNNLRDDVETHAEESGNARSVKAKLKKSTKPKRDAGLGDDIALWLNNLRPIATSSEPDVTIEDSLDVFSATGGHSDVGEGNKPCKKFPFKGEDFPYEKKRSPAASKTQTKCPKKKSRRMVEDCPKDEGDENKKCVKPFSRQEYRMSADKKKGHDDAKCPRVELGICKDKGIEDDDPCNVKRKGKTWKCPTDLLKKKKRNPRKKSSGVETSLPLPSQNKPTDSTTSV